MKDQTLWILERVKRGEMSTQSAQRQLFVIFGISKSSVCRLDRIPKECCIALHTSLKDCKECGHYIKD